MKNKLEKYMIFITVIFMDLLTGMEFDIFVPSFPELQNHFGLSHFWVEALLSVNFIGYCLSLFFVGGLADRYGRKPIILLGLITFIIGSIVCLTTASYHLFLVGRFLQGVGIASPAILSFLIIADSYPLKEQQFLLAMLNGSLNIAAGIAPVIGSYLTYYFHWQANFIALLLLGLFTLVMTVWFIPSSKLMRAKEAITVQGYLALFQSKALILLMVTILFIFVPYWIFVGMSPLLYIKNLGVSLAHFGYYQGVLPLLFAAGSVIYGLWMKNSNYDQKDMLKVAVTMLIISFVVIGLVTFVNSTNPLFITLAVLTFIISQIIPSIILYPLSLHFMPEAKGKISAVIQGARLILAAVSLQIAGYFYQGTFQDIGIIICVFILFAIITLFFVIRNRELMDSLGQ